MIFKGRNCRKGEKGSVTVEAVVAFTGFLFVIFTILNIVNFCRAQVLISNAMDTVTKELTQYSYFYKVSGLQKFDQDIQAIGEDGAMNLNTVANSVGNFYGSMGTAIDTTEEEATNLANSLLDGSIDSNSINEALQHVDNSGTNVATAINNMDSQFKQVADNPVLYLKSIVAVAGSNGLELAKSHALAAPLAKGLMIKHFGGNYDEANAELERLGVVGGMDGMNFGMSTIFTKDAPDDIHLVVYYKLKLVQIFDWAEFEATLCKESRARAWLSGDAEKVKMPTPAPPVSGAGPSGGSVPEESTEPETKESETEESTEAESAEELKARMAAKYGQEIVDAACAGMDTSDWSELDWEMCIFDWTQENGSGVSETEESTEDSTDEDDLYDDIYEGQRETNEEYEDFLDDIEEEDENPSAQKTEIDYITTNGVKLVATPGKTTTVLGTYKEDTEKILDELGNVKSLDFGPRDGGFNLLNVPDEIYDDFGEIVFWEQYNKPWLDNAIARDDIIILATPPNEDVLYRKNPVTGEKELSGFGKEIKYLEQNGYEYDKKTKCMKKKEEK